MWILQELTSVPTFAAAVKRSVRPLICSSIPSNPLHSPALSLSSSSYHISSYTVKYWKEFLYQGIKVFFPGDKTPPKGWGIPTNLGIFVSQVPLSQITFINTFIKYKHITTFIKSHWISYLLGHGWLEETIQSGGPCLVPNLWSLNIPRVKASKPHAHLT